MKNIFHFLRLIRFINLMVIALTMVVVEVFVLTYSSVPPQNYFNNFCFTCYFDHELIGFYLLLISTLLIAAAGNIINDYFDVKADRINKPKRLIIGKHIKRRWAMVMHWSFNVMGLIIALYVGYVLQNIWIPLIAFLSINLLWFYSVYFKRKAFIGNVIVAILLGVIPIYVLVLNLPIHDIIIHTELKDYTVSKSYIIEVVLFISSLAFLQNLIRELTKDIQDISGDLRLNAQTFPIKYGVKKTKLLITLFWVITLITMAFYYGSIVLAELGFLIQKPRGFNMSDFTNFNINTFGYLLLASLILFTISFIIILISKTKKNYKMGSLILKLSMVLGLLTPLFL